MNVADAKSVTWRFALLGALVLAMIIPLAFVGGVTEERQDFFERTVADVAGAWGGEQTFDGPYLVIPERPATTPEAVAGEQNKAPEPQRAIVLPARFDVRLRIDHELRRRALYEVPVYTAVLEVRGEFPPLDHLAGIEAAERLLMDRARIALGITHPHAIAEVAELELGASALAFEPGTGGVPWLHRGIHAAVPAYDGSQAQPFSFEISLRGTRALSIAPVGGESRIDAASSWPHPSFGGQLLPERYDTRADGFTATWRTSKLARVMPGGWMAASTAPSPSHLLASVRLFQPVTGYQVVDRAIKYGILFIALTFITFVCFELTFSMRFHPVQYGVVGLALVLFYLTLLSLSEHLPFGAAYGVATLLLTGLIAWYVKGMSGSLPLAGFTGAVIGTLYGVLYVLLKLETFALLVGTAVLLAGLFGLMFATRSLTFAEEDWPTEPAARRERALRD